MHNNRSPKTNNTISTLYIVNRTIILLAAALFIVALATSCHQKQTGEVVTSTKEENVDKDAPYVEGNKKILQWEQEEIALFVKRYGWTMTQTGTGLFVEITKNGSGTHFQEGDRITLAYKIFRLDGSPVYNSEQDGLKQFTIGKSEEISGLHEAALLLNPGAEARLVIPAHLAYGVAGDGNKLIGRQPIAMTLQVIQ